VVRRIIWTSHAEFVFSEILEFYYKRNGNKIYSKKLYLELIQILNLLKKNPYLGKETNAEKTRVFIKNYFKIFYRIEPDEIIVFMIWDCRQNPDDLKL
jgi:plasmid stabilization system protein ParE